MAGTVRTRAKRATPARQRETGGPASRLLDWLTALVAGEKVEAGRVPPFNDGTGRLTEAGREFVMRYIAKHGSGVGLLRKIYPATWRRAKAVGVSDAEIERCCQDATVEVALRYDPRKGKFVTLLTWYVRMFTQKGIDERLGWRDLSPNKPERLVSLDFTTADGATMHHNLPAPDMKDDVYLDIADGVERVRETLMAGPDGERRWEVLRRRHGLGCQAETLESISRRLGISKERTRQIEAMAVRHVRAWMGVSGPMTALGA